MDNFAAVESIFFAALDKNTPEERGAYLDLACGGDRELRASIERLLRAEPKVGHFLQAPAPGLPATAAGHLLAEGPGTRIGPYKLLQQIGEGGMGVVYMTEQEQPVKRRVALKIIKPGMDSGQVVARFEAERQALAMMDHQNIARVLDAESVLREALAICEKKEPDGWTTFNTQSLLGGALLGQKKYADAEPLLLAGCEGLKQCEAKIPALSRDRLTMALERLVQLYEATGQKDQATKWRKELYAGAERLPLPEEPASR